MPSTLSFARFVNSSHPSLSRFKTRSTDNDLDMTRLQSLISMIKTTKGEVLLRFVGKDEAKTSVA